MMRKSWPVTISVALWFLALHVGAHAKSVTLEFGTSDFATYRTAREELGTFHTLQFAIPKEIVGARLDGVILELYVDVALEDGVAEGTTPVIEVLPLTDQFTGDGVPKFTPTSTAVRNVVPGERRKLLLDVTEIVKGWIADPATNHGVIIGTLTGRRDGTFMLRDDVLGGGKVAKVTFVYQNRFGERVLH